MVSAAGSSVTGSAGPHDASSVQIQQAFCGMTQAIVCSALSKSQVKSALWMLAQAALNPWSSHGPSDSDASKDVDYEVDSRVVVVAAAIGAHANLVQLSGMASHNLGTATVAAGELLSGAELKALRSLRRKANSAKHIWTVPELKKANVGAVPSRPCHHSKTVPCPAAFGSTDLGSGAAAVGSAFLEDIAKLQPKQLPAAELSNDSWEGSALGDDSASLQDCPQAVDEGHLVLAQLAELGAQRLELHYLMKKLEADKKEIDVDDANKAKEIGNDLRLLLPLLKSFGYSCVIDIDTRITTLEAQLDTKSVHRHVVKKLMAEMQQLKDIRPKIFEVQQIEAFLRSVDPFLATKERTGAIIDELAHHKETKKAVQEKIAELMQSRFEELPEEGSP